MRLLRAAGRFQLRLAPRSANISRCETSCQPFYHGVIVSKNDAELLEPEPITSVTVAVPFRSLTLRFDGTSVQQFVMWGYVPDDVSQRPKPERKALIKQALDRFLNEDLQYLREPPAPPAGGKPLAGPKTEELSR